MSRLDISNLHGARRSLYPTALSPMLASPTEKAFSSASWIFEPKLDGIRCLALMRGGTATLLSRRGLDMTHQYPTLAKQIEAAVCIDAVLDGEIIALDETGRPSFQQLQQRMNLTKRADIERADANVPVFFFAFDILFAEDSSVIGVPLITRKEMLRIIVEQSDHVRVLDHFEEDGCAAYDACVEHGFEGIVAKRRDSHYEMGRRSPAWLKLKAQQTGDFIVAGFTAGSGWRSTTFGALLLAYKNDAGKLQYAGSVGTGFDDKLIRELMRRFEPLYTKKRNFAKNPEGKEKITWLEPVLVAEIKFMDWTRDFHLRAPVFLRLREDKVAEEITFQRSVQPVAETSVGERAAEVSPTKKAIEVPVAVVAETSAQDFASDVYVTVSRNTGTQPAPDDSIVHCDDEIVSSVIQQLDSWAKKKDKDKVTLFVGTESISISHLDKVFWPATETSPAVTKRDYLLYLAKIARPLLAHLVARPLTVVRAPNGVKYKPFFQKHWKDLPEFFETTGVVDVEGEPQEFLLCNNFPTLMYLGQHSALELHTMCSRVQPFAADEGELESRGAIKTGTTTDINDLLEFPDYIVLDLDVHDKEKPPTEIRKEEFAWVCDVALALREPLSTIGATPFVKLSGKGGVHIYIPVIRNLDFDHARVISETLAQYATKLRPQLATTAFKVEQRAGKVYVDTSSNIHRKTMIAPYSPRLTVWGTVSLPVTWKELEACQWIPCTMDAAIERLRTQGDIWKNILSCKIDLHKSISSANK